MITFLSISGSSRSSCSSRSTYAQLLDLRLPGLGLRLLDVDRAVDRLEVLDSECVAGSASMNSEPVGTVITSPLRPRSRDEPLVLLAQLGLTCSNSSAVSVSLRQHDVVDELLQRPVAEVIGVVSSSKPGHDVRLHHEVGQARSIP